LSFLLYDSSTYDREHFKRLSYTQGHGRNQSNTLIITKLTHFKGHRHRATDSMMSVAENKNEQFSDSFIRAGPGSTPKSVEKGAAAWACPET
jgi:hypothetical protein